MVQFSNVILAYLIIGSVMWGGGAVAWGQTGVNQFFIEYEDGQVNPSTCTQEEIEAGKQCPGQKIGNAGGTITDLVAQFGGPVVIVWNLLTSLLSWLHWPVTVLVAVDAPPRIVVVGGVPFVAAFYLSLIRVVRSSA